MRILWFCLLGALPACNAILGIDEAVLDPSDAGPDANAGSVTGTGSSGAAGAGGAAGTGGAGGQAGDGEAMADAGCSIRATDPCSQCVSQNCCAKFDACIGNVACKAALAAYNTCVGVNFTNDAGGTCDEDFATAGGELPLNLGTCAFLDGATSNPPGCAEKCRAEPLGREICVTYCDCLSTICPEKESAITNCSTKCGAFTADQLRCRPYHCELARKAKTNMDEPGRLVHCGHTAGEALCP